MDHTKVHAYLELVEDRTEKIKLSNSAAKAITAAYAFRKYEWLKRVPGKFSWNLGISPVKNIAGNFRGMVLSKSLRTAFDITVKTGEKLERVTTFLRVTEAIMHSYGQIGHILTSTEPISTKSAKLGPQLTAVAMKFLTGLVTPWTHALLTSLPVQGYCDTVDLARGVATGTCSRSLRNVDVIIAVSAEELSDGDAIYTWVNTSINPRVSRLLGM